MAAARKAKGKARRKTEGTTGTSAAGEVGVPSAVENLAPTARELLEAARRLLETQDYSSLTLKAIGREAGQNESLIGYHFGSKTGLMVALVDWLLYDTLRDLQARVAQLSEGENQLHLAVDDSRKLIGDVDSYRAFYRPPPAPDRDPRGPTTDGRSLPRLPRDERQGALAPLRQRHGRPKLGHSARCTSRSPTAWPSRSLMDPGGVDVQLVAELWEDFVRHSLLGEQG